MKKSISLFVLVAFIATANATVRLVNNNPNSPEQYKSLQTAINASNPGDTIYVSGSNTSYGTVDLNVRLVLIATGYNPQKQVPLYATVGTITLDSSLANSTGATGSVIEGFYISGNVTYNYIFNNIKIIRNYITSYLYAYGNNWLIQNNILYDVQLNNNSNVVIENNIITYNINTSNQPNVIITNNLFIDNSATGYCFSNISNATITNNIFYGVSPGSTTSQCSDCVFNNNITWGSSNTAIPFANNTGTGNFANQNPVFTSIATVNYTFTSTDNYILKASSPGHLAGTDATDIGPFGGSTPFPSSPIGLEPRIPQVKTMNILNSTVPANGSLNLSVKGKNQN